MLIAPARKIYNRGIPKIIGEYSSLRLRKRLPFESQLERDYLIHLDADLSIKNFQTQPLTINYTDVDYKQREYTPDVLIEWHDKNRNPLLVEVKPFEITQTETFRAWLVQLRQVLALKGYEFVVVTEREIQGPRLNQLNSIWQYGRARPTQYACDQTRKCLAKRRHRVTVKELAVDTTPLGVTATDILSQLFYGYLHSEWNTTKPLLLLVNAEENNHG